ncbi:MAG TPA: ACT domain-containing protein, partial [Ruminococcaceae bacterium]|nr:ACT domain-containing protein [Oscillospiraceae bacterium]
MRAIITVVGQDTVGILASVSGICADHNANVIEVTQSVMEDLFV